MSTNLSPHKWRDRRLLRFGISLVTTFLFVFPILASPVKTFADPKDKLSKDTIGIEQQVVEEPVVEDPVIEEPIVEEPVVEEPVVEEPVIEEPIVEEPVIEEPVVEEVKPEAPLTYLAAPIVIVNKEDYKPGGKVNMKGSGWILDSSVSIEVREVYGTWRLDTVAEVDSLGQFALLFNIADYYSPNYEVDVTGVDTKTTVNTSFTDDGGAYSIDFSSYNPDTYQKYIAKYYAPLANGYYGRTTDKLNTTLHTNSVESLAPEDLVLGQIVPFEAQITVNGSTAPENGTITMEMLWSTETTSKSAFGFDDSYRVYAAFVDSTESVDPGGDASVTGFTEGTGSGYFTGVVTVSGLDNGDTIIVEIWVVLQDTLPNKIVGNNDTSLIRADTAPALPNTPQVITKSAQTVPLLRPGDFLDFGSLQIIKNFTGWPAGYDLPDQVTVMVRSISYTFPLVIDIDQSTGIGSITQAGLVPGTYAIDEISIANWSSTYPNGRTAIVPIKGLATLSITNANNEVTSVSGTKTWIGPAGSTLVHLFADGVDTGKSATLDADHLTYEFTGLDKYNNTDGKIIIYTVAEDDMVGWTEIQNGFNFTNINDEVTSVSGTKTWIGPAGSTLVHLFADGVDTGKSAPLDGTHLTYEFTGLDKYNNTDGKPIVYTVVEDDMVGWTEIQDGFDFTNINDETKDIKVQKIWIGAPAPTMGSITANVYRDTETTPYASVELTPTSWTNTFYGLDKYSNTDGHEYVYTVRLDEADINAAMWILSGPVLNAEGVLVFTNTYIPQDSTAWAANTMNSGTIQYTSKNWATYLAYKYGDAPKTVAAFTGQTTKVGTVTLTSVTGGVRIDINLVGFEFQVGGVVSIQGYTKLPPKKNPSPGQFDIQRPASGTSFSFIVPGTSYIYYGVHMMVHKATIELTNNQLIY